MIYSSTYFQYTASSVHNVTHTQLLNVLEKNDLDNLVSLNDDESEQADTNLMPGMLLLNLSSRHLRCMSSAINNYAC